VSRQVQETSTAVTNGVRIAVGCRYLADHSFPLRQRYVFAYTVRIQNEGKQAVQLLSRHWVITDCSGKVEEVRGEGVVGEQPVLPPGGSFEYMSTATLALPRGSMHGTYQMRDLRGRQFDATIAPFLLALPHSLN
jgi:ApaG protein